MEYTAIRQMLEYWKEPDPVHCTDEWRRTRDLDCILVGGDLRADMLFSLWLPLRYALNYFDCPQWVAWKEKEYAHKRKRRFELKRCPEFLNDLENNTSIFLPDGEDKIAKSLERLFELGQTRANVIILPERSWNRERGKSPYYDYMPHFLYDFLKQGSTTSSEAVENWIRDQHLDMFFEGGEIAAGALRDLARTGNVKSHKPGDINVSLLLGNYCNILEQRAELVAPGETLKR